MATLLLHLVSGVVLGTVIMILRFFESTKDYGKGFAWPLRLIPSFAMADGIICLAKQLSITFFHFISRDLYAMIEGKVNPYPDYFSFDAAAPALLMTWISYVLSILLLFLIESGIMNCHLSAYENCVL